MIAWNLADGKILKKKAFGRKDLYDLSFSADGSTIAAACGDTRVDVLSASSWKEKGSMSGRYLRRAVLSDDGNTVIGCDNDRIRVAALSGKVLFEQPVGRLKLLAPVPSQNSVVAVTDEGKIAVYDYREGKIVRETDKLKKKWEDPFVSCAACSFKSGEAVFVTEGAAFHAVDMNTGTKGRAFAGKGSGVAEAKFLRKADRLVVKLDSSTRTLIADLADQKKKIVSIRDGGAMAVLPDEKNIALGSSHSLQKYDSSTGAHTGAVSQFVYDGLCADVSADGKFAAVGCSDGTVWFNPVSDVFAIRKLNDIGSAPRSLAFSPDGKKLLGCGDGKAMLWNCSDEEKAVLFEDKARSFRACAFSPDGGYAALGAKDGSLMILPSAGGKPLFSALCGSAVSAAAFSADGRYVLCGCVDGIIRVFSASDGALRFSLAGHSGMVSALSLLPRHRVMSSSADGSVKVWDLEAGTLAGTVFLSEEGFSVIAWDGRYDGSEKGLEQMHWTAGNEVIPMGDFGSSFRDKGLLVKLLNGEVPGGPAAEAVAEKKPEEEKKPEPAGIDVMRRLVGRVHSIRGEEVVVSYAGTGHMSMIKDRYFIVSDSGEKIYLESVFPMMASTRCRAEKSASLKKMKKGMPVFK